MKRLTFLLTLCFGLVSAWGQTAKEEIFDHIQLAGANYYAYPTPHYTYTRAPKGYRPFYFSHYARHGSRYLINPKTYSRPIEALEQAKRFGTLTDEGEKALRIVRQLSDGAQKRFGELTQLGAEQHRGIAERMYRNFPEIFKKDIEVDARSTVVIRCILSKTAECLQLQALNPALRFTNDASEHDMAYLNFNNPNFDPIRRAPEVQARVNEFNKAHTHPERLMKTLFNDDNYIKWNVNADQLMGDLFDLAVSVQNLDGNQPDLLYLFTKDELYDQWLMGNFFWYTYYGPSTLTKGLMPYLEANLLQNILDTADRQLAQDKESATLRFGHEVCVLPLACLLELDHWGKPVDNPEQLADQWRNYNLFPMGCNVQLIFYKNPKNNDVLVKALMNEKEAKLPVESDLAPYYHWSDVEKYYRAKLERYNQLPESRTN